MTVPLVGEGRLRRYHQARWDEPLIFELSRVGQRGILPPTDPAIHEAVGHPAASLPTGVRRFTPPRLPELSQLEVLRHYIRLSEETLGVDNSIALGLGTCTMKYSPKVNDTFVRSAKVAEVHPLQDEETFQGLLEITWRLQQFLKAISGMDGISLQPSAGGAAIYANSAVIRAYHASRGESLQRDEIVTTLWTHPTNAAVQSLNGFRVITLRPEADGLPTIDALRAAVSERTAGLFIANPEDSGLFNPQIAEFTSIVHAAGGLCAYDQANANGILGITTARDAGFDLCHFNLHKTFSTPHAGGGPGAAAMCVTEELAPYLPTPTVERDGERFFLDYDRPQSIGKIRPFYGTTPNIVRAYAWIAALGGEGLREAAEVAVLNNNYLARKLLDIPGCSAPFDPGRYPIEQVRLGWGELESETGVTSADIGRRASDFGVHYWLSHEPWIVPEPFTPEPTESAPKADLDEFAAIMAHIAHEARTNPELVRSAPHASSVHRIDPSFHDQPDGWALTWRAMQRKKSLGFANDGSVGPAPVLRGSPPASGRRWPAT